uniref:DUF4216 domain-containing protein n=1 Tax=Chenopodium quinoa TaxID=63459 RepID=A0A803N4Z9_CHEQI
MGPLVFDATNAWNNSTTYEVHSDGGNAMEFGSSSGNDETPSKELMTLLEDMEAKLYPGFAYPAFKGVIDEKVLEPLRELSLIFKQLCSKTLKGIKQLAFDEWKEDHLYVLKNCEEAQPFLDEYLNDTSLPKIDFYKWFENKIIKLLKDGDVRVTEELFCLARGPMKRVVTYDGYIINGFRFHTKKRQRNRKTQNSGVVVKGDEESGEKNFYGILEEVIVLEYGALKNRTSPKVILFKCKWFDVFSDGKGIKKDNLEAVLINVTRRYVIKANPRNFFDFPNDEDTHESESLWDHVAPPVTNYENKYDEDINIVRDDVENEVALDDDLEDNDDDNDSSSE